MTSTVSEEIRLAIDGFENAVFARADWNPAEQTLMDVKEKQAIARRRLEAAISAAIDAAGYNPSLDQALNSGDGVYRP